MDICLTYLVLCCNPVKFSCLVFHTTITCNQVSFFWVFVLFCGEGGEGGGEGNWEKRASLMDVHGAKI